jgi:hypothetical protein
MIFPHANQPTPLSVNDEVGIPDTFLGRDRLGRSIPALAIHTLVGEVDVEHLVRVDDVRAATVLMDARADVCALSGDVDD